MTLSRRTRVLAVVLFLIATPVALATLAAVAFFATNRNNGSFVSSGVLRKYLLYVPRRYDGRKPVPLVISLHGAGGWPVQQMRLTRWNRVAEREGFIVVYPSGADRGSPRIWNSQPGAGLTRDVRFISQLIDHLEAAYNIDPNRVYVNGVSNGGGMSFVLSCRLSGRIAAAGLVAAAQTLPWKWCTDPHPVPMIAFHGTDDPVTPYNGGVSSVSDRLFPNVPIWSVNWARRNGCRPDAIETVAAADVVRREYSGCTNDASVVLYTIRGGGHTWPGGEPLPEWFAGRTTSTIDASELMWAFFRAHPLTASSRDSRPSISSTGS